MYFGSHVSISKGYTEAAKIALSMGAKSFQYFPKNPRTLSIKRFDYQDAIGCAAFSRKNGLLSIAHTPYPTNLAVDDTENKEIMVNSILNDLEIAEACESIGVVIHFGKYKGEDPLKGYKNIISLLNTILVKWQGSALILIENQASLMGMTMEEMVQIRSMVLHPQKIGFCFDTCHAFASGLWDGQNWHKLVEKGIKLDYLPHVKAIHFNDSMFPHGSFRDRHSNIGKGYIGEENLKAFLNSYPSFNNIPIILETPQSANFNHNDEIKLLNQNYINKGTSPS